MISGETEFEAVQKILTWVVDRDLFYGSWMDSHWRPGNAAVYQQPVYSCGSRRVDNNETEQDGLVQWSRLKGSSGAPRLSENIDAGFVTDNIKVEGTEMSYGPRELLLSPRIEAAFTEVSIAPSPPPPPVIQEKE